MSNPFETIGYINPNNFCGREKELSALLLDIDNGANKTLLSKRRMGKTALLYHLKHELGKQKRRMIIVDLYATNNIKEFINALVRELIKELNKKKSVFDKFIHALAHLRPVTTVDSMGNLGLEFNFIDSSHATSTLQDIFELLRKEKESFIIAFDEFQQIADYPENTEALLRTEIQKTAKHRFIFSGSSEHVLLQMFSDKKRPFYQSTNILYLEEIDRETYRLFIKRKFKKVKRNISEESIEEIFNWSRVHTFYTQKLCHDLYATQKMNIVLNDVYEEEYRILKERESEFALLTSLLVKKQFKILKAVSKEGAAIRPTSAAILKKYDLGASSSVKTAINSLLKKDFLYRRDGQYFVYDVFFNNWLKTL